MRIVRPLTDCAEGHGGKYSSEERNNIAQNSRRDPDRMANLLRNKVKVVEIKARGITSLTYIFVGESGLSGNFFVKIEKL